MRPIKLLCTQHRQKYSLLTIYVPYIISDVQIKSFYLLLKSYLSERYFQVKIDNEFSDYHSIRAGVPQISVLGPLLYLLYTADVPTIEDTLMATFADDTPILSSDHDPVPVTEKLQHHLRLLQTWLEQ